MSVLSDESKAAAHDFLCLLLEEGHAEVLIREAEETDVLSLNSEEQYVAFMSMLSQKTMETSEND